jgi:hypothetical protein
VRQFLFGRYFKRHEYDQQKGDGCCVATSTATAEPLSIFLFMCLSASLGYLLYSTDNPTERDMRFGTEEKKRHIITVSINRCKD